MTETFNFSDKDFPALQNEGVNRRKKKWINHSENRLKNNTTSTSPENEPQNLIASSSVEGEYTRRFAVNVEDLLLVKIL